jgi:predicted HAD superfamily Cof-like phosphohydrolase
MKVWDETLNVDMVDDVMEFAKKFCSDQIRTSPGFPTPEIIELRRKLIDEEVNEELLKAIDNDDIVEIADAGADAIVVIIGTLIAYGIPTKAVWRAVQRSNMAKAQPDGSVKRREDGKVMKPEGWTPPDIGAVLKEAGLQS